MESIQPTQKMATRMHKDTDYKTVQYYVGTEHPADPKDGDVYYNSVDCTILVYQQQLGWVPVASASPQDDLEHVAEVIRKELGDGEMKKILG